MQQQLLVRNKQSFRLRVTKKVVKHADGTETTETETHDLPEAEAAQVCAAAVCFALLTLTLFCCFCVAQLPTAEERLAAFFESNPSFTAPASPVPASAASASASSSSSAAAAAAPTDPAFTVEQALQLLTDFVLQCIVTSPTSAADHNTIVQRFTVPNQTSIPADTGSAGSSFDLLFAFTLQAAEGVPEEFKQWATAGMALR